MKRLIVFLLLVGALGAQDIQIDVKRATATSDFTVYAASGGGAVEIHGPDTGSVNYTIKMPAAAPTAAGQCIVTTGTTPFAQLDWETCGGGGGGGAPFSDATPIVKGAADATKLLRFSVSGFTTATTRVITPPNADINLPGTNIANTWTATQTTHSILPSTDNTYVIGNGTVQFNDIESTGFAAGLQGSRRGIISIFNSANSDAPFIAGGIQGFTNSFDVQATFVPTFNVTFDLGGDSTHRYRKLWVQDIDASGICTGCGGGSGSAPFADTTSLVYNNADNTKQMRFELSGYTTGTTRVLTPPDADITLPGINIGNTWTATQTMRDIATTNVTYAIGSSGGAWANIYASHLQPCDPITGTACWSIEAAGGTNKFFLKNPVGGLEIQIDDGAHTGQIAAAWLPATDNTWELGDASVRWSNTYSQLLNVAGATTFNTVAYTWPGSDGSSGQFLQTNGSGTLSWASGGGGGSGYDTIEEEGSAVTQRTTLNFIGASLTAVDDAGNVRTNVTLSQSPSGSTSVVGTGHTISTSSPLGGGGALTGDLTLTCSTCVTAVNVTTPITTTGGTSPTIACPTCVATGGTYTSSLSFVGASAFLKGTKMEVTNSGGSATYIYSMGSSSTIMTLTDASGGSMVSYLTSGLGDSVTYSASLLPTSTSFVVGSSFNPWGNMGTVNFSASGTATMSGTNNFTGTQTYSGSNTFSTAISALNGANISFGSGDLKMQTGNFYDRAFSGADAGCGGVTDGWMGIRTDTHEIQICIGGTNWKATLH